MHIEQLARHARDLAAAFHLELIEDSSRHPLQADARHIAADTIHVNNRIIPTPGSPERRIVTLHPIVDEGIYAIALHEMGHHLAPNGMIPVAVKHAASTLEGIANLLLHEEESAWEWAQHYALVWTDLMTSIRSFALFTYRMHVEQGRRLDEEGARLGLDIQALRKEFLAKK